MVDGVGGLQGTLAELIAVDADLPAHKPENLSKRHAAALPLVVITAWEALVARARIFILSSDTVAKSFRDSLRKVVTSRSSLRASAARKSLYQEDLRRSCKS
jgi:hypothetical protein